MSEAVVITGPGPGGCLTPRFNLLFFLAEAPPAPAAARLVFLPPGVAAPVLSGAGLAAGANLGHAAALTAARSALAAVAWLKKMTQVGGGGPRGKVQWEGMANAKCAGQKGHKLSAIRP